MILSKRALLKAFLMSRVTRYRSLCGFWLWFLSLNNSLRLPLHLWCIFSVLKPHYLGDSPFLSSNSRLILLQIMYSAIWPMVLSRHIGRYVGPTVSIAAWGPPHSRTFSCWWLAKRSTKLFNVNAPI